MSVAAFGMAGDRSGPRSVAERRSLRLGAGVGSLTVIGVVLTAVVLLPSGPSPAAERASRRNALVSWEATVEPIVQSGGQVVALGPRYAAAQLQHHKLTPAQLRTMAQAWTRRLGELGRQLSGVPTPRFLRAAHELLDQAMTGYVTASRRLLEAADATGAQRQHLLDEAAAAGKAADHTYDRATAALARWRAQLGLPTDWSG